MSILLRLSILAAFASVNCIAGDFAESRFKPSKARKLTPEQAKLFGPGADKIRYDATMIRAAEIAAQRARKQ